MPTDLLAWSAAWERAAFGADGFYRREQARDHFATDITDGTAVVDRLTALVLPELARLAVGGQRATVIDVGSDDARLLLTLRERVDPALAERLDWRAIDMRPRPAGLPDCIDWVPADARTAGAWAEAGPGVLIAHELLDDIPCDIVEVDDHGERRLVLVDPATSLETLGPSTKDVDACAAYGVDGLSLDTWCDQWWPRRQPAARIEVGRSRDEAWRTMVDVITDGITIAVDYGHVRADRDDGVWDGGTLNAFRRGRAVSLACDGTANLTAHVSIDSCAAATRAVATELARSPEGLWWLVQRMGR